MREKIGALIQYISIVVAFALVFSGVAHAYQLYFGYGAVAKAVADLVLALVGFGVGLVGLFVGNLLKR